MSAFWAMVLAFIKSIPIKTWIQIGLWVSVITAAIIFITKYTEMKKELGTAQNNNTAYQAQLEGAQNNIVQFQLSMQQLRFFNDSISKKLVETVDKLKIKDKQVKELQYMLETYVRHDTVRLRDTIFLDSEFCFDTIIGDQWMNTSVHLEYPSTIGVTPRCKSEKVVVAHTTRETINPPSKCFFIRWFQRKHTVTRIWIEESNPYIENSLYFNTITSK